MDEFSGYATIPQEEDYFGDAEFMLYTYKVERCMISQPHSWKKCPFVHHQEPIKRRHPTQHMAHLCPLVKKGQTCPDDRCCWAHNAFELWLHPERYKTIMCRKGAACGRGICFFAHSETELRVPTKAKPVDLSNPAAAAGALGAALKFKAVAQALPNAAISTAPVCGRRSPVSLQLPDTQNQQLLGVPSMSLGVPAMSQGVAAMSLGVPAMPQGVPAVPQGVAAMSLGVPAVPQGVSAMSQGVPAMLLGLTAMSPGVLAVSQGVPATSLRSMPVGDPAPTVSTSFNVAAPPGLVAVPQHTSLSALDLRYMNAMTGPDTSLKHSQQLSWPGSASSASAAASNSICSSSSHSHCGSSSSSTRLSATASSSIRSTIHSQCGSSSSSTRLDCRAGDWLLSGLDACTANNVCSSSAAKGAASVAPVAFGQQHTGVPAAMHAGLPGPALTRLAVPPQQPPPPPPPQQQQPVLLHLAQAAAAVRAEVDKGVGADQEVALQVAADRVAALLFTGHFAGLCAGGDCCPARLSPAVPGTAGNRRSVDFPVGDITVEVAQQMLVRSGSV